MVVSSVLSVFTVEKARDGDGNEIQVSGEHKVDILFRCVLACSIRTIIAYGAH